MADEITQIWIGGIKVGMVGLKNAFAELKALNLNDPEKIKTEIINRLQSANYIPAEAETAYKDALYDEYRIFLGEAVPGQAGPQEILILGPGCLRCEELMRRVKNVIAELKLAINVEHVQDLNKIAEYGPVQTPVLIVNGEIKFAGRLPSSEEIKKALL
jgi:small redox-active disulfide protein 2